MNNAPFSLFVFDVKSVSVSAFLDVCNLQHPSSVSELRARRNPAVPAFPPLRSRRSITYRYLSAVLDAFRDAEVETCSPAMRKTLVLCFIHGFKVSACACDLPLWLRHTCEPKWLQPMPLRARSRLEDMDTKLMMLYRAATTHSVCFKYSARTCVVIDRPRNFPLAPQSYPPACASQSHGPYLDLPEVRDTRRPQRMRLAIQGMVDEQGHRPRGRQLDALAHG